MSFDHRSYGGKKFRPSPHVHVEDNENLIIVATPWGESDAAEKVVQIMVDYYMSAMDDFEATAPFEKLSCLSLTANHLRIACMIANEYLYREVNKSEYQAGIEVFAAAAADNELVFVQLGLPHILLSRNNRSLVPISTGLDLSFDLSEDAELLPPLPNQLMGLDPTCHITVNSIRPQPGDKVLLVARSHLPAELFAQDNQGVTVKEISRILAKDSVDLPFWLGLYTPS